MSSLSGKVDLLSTETSFTRSIAVVASTEHWSVSVIRMQLLTDPGLGRGDFKLYSSEPTQEAFKSTGWYELSKIYDKQI
jgi:hypothetical protein